MWQASGQQIEASGDITWVKFLGSHHQQIQGEIGNGCGNDTWRTHSGDCATGEKTSSSLHGWCVPPFSVRWEVCNVGSTYRSAASTVLWGPLVGCTQSPHISTESWQFTFWSSNPTICWNSVRRRTLSKFLCKSWDLIWDQVHHGQGLGCGKWQPIPRIIPR